MSSSEVLRTRKDGCGVGDVSQYVYAVEQRKLIMRWWVLRPRIEQSLDE